MANGDGENCIARALLDPKRRQAGNLSRPCGPVIGFPEHEESPTPLAFEALPTLGGEVGLPCAEVEEPAFPAALPSC